MTHTIRTRPTTGQRAGWAAAGAATTLAALAAGAYAWAAALERNERYGTHQRLHERPR